MLVTALETLAVALHPVLGNHKSFFSCESNSLQGFTNCAVTNRFTPLLCHFLLAQMTVFLGKRAKGFQVLNFWLGSTSIRADCSHLAGLLLALEPQIQGIATNGERSANLAFALTS